MATRVLVTTTSFLETPGSHHDLLASQGYEIIKNPKGRRLTEEEMLELVGDVDGIICGDDAITRRVMEKALPRLKVISKYGIGLDKIDLDAATELKIPVCFTPGVNDMTVAEHTFGLMIGLAKNIPLEDRYVKSGQWKRITGHEIGGKTLGIIGLGRIGKQVAKRAKVFEMQVIAYDIYFDDEFAKQYGVEKASSPQEVFSKADIVTLHCNLTKENEGFVNRKLLETAKDGIYLVNCARGELVNVADLVEALKSGKVAGYAADVLEKEPPDPDHPLFQFDNVILTPHIGSRTYESVVRQATMAVKNLVAVLNGEKPLAQANQF